MMTSQIQKRVCAIYTRKSHEEGLEQRFNSLDAQRLSCESYIVSQQFNGWELCPKHYDDGGFSGGTIDRPALKELLTDIEAGKINVVVIYKMDRLSRSLTDFAELQGIFEKHDVSFVSVTQQIDTSGSAGRMMLNILMTFAQYEREIIAERIRDKMSATRRQGKFVGGTLPFGYCAVNKRLEICDSEAEIIHRIFDRYLEIQSPKQIAAELNADGIMTRRGNPWTITNIYGKLRSRVFIGEIEYKGEVYKGEHEAIIDRAQWDEVQRLLIKNSPVNRGQDAARQSINAPLKGLLRCGHCNCAMVPHYAKKKDGRKYYYYVCLKDTKRGVDSCPVHRIPGGDVEQLVIRELGLMFQSRTFKNLFTAQAGLDADEVEKQFADIGALWKEFYPAERQKLIHLMVEKVVANTESIEIENQNRRYEKPVRGETK
ncbi:MAG: recombinase family protein [Evtepia sp.]